MARPGHCPPLEQRRWGQPKRIAPGESERGPTGIGVLGCTGGARMCPLHMSGRFTLRAGPHCAAGSACRAVCPHALREEGLLLLSSLGGT